MEMVINVGHNMQMHMLPAEMINLTDDLKDSCEGLPVSNLSSTAASYALNSTLEITLLAVVLPMFLCVGLFGNLIFIYSVFRIKRLQSITNYYLTALAFCDIAVILGAFFFLVWPITTSPVSFDVPFICWIPVFVTVAGYQASTGLITMVTVERYIGVCHALKYRVLSSVKRTKVIILIVVFISMILSANATPVLGKTVAMCIIWPNTKAFQNLPSVVNTCTSAMHRFPFQEVIFNDILFYICLIVNFILYWKIIKGLSAKTPQSKEKIEEVRHRTARVLIVNGCVFFLCNIPARISNFANSVSLVTTEMPWLGDADFEIVNLVLRFGLVVNSAINPFIYGLLSTYYRQAVMEAFCVGPVPRTKAVNNQRTWDRQKPSIDSV